MRYLLLALLALSRCHPLPAADVSVFFSPRGGCTDAVVQEVAKAKTSIVLEAYNFTSPRILHALLEAKKRGVKIQAVYDRSQRNLSRSLADELGVKAMFGSAKIMHNKVLIIDSSTVITGSFNFTVNAEEFNSENLVVIKDKALAGKYQQAFDRLVSTATLR